VELAFRDVVDEHVETPLIGVDAREQRLDVFGLEVIHADGDAAAAARRHHLRRLLDGLGAAGVRAGRRRVIARAAPGAVNGGARFSEHAGDAARHRGSRRRPRHAAVQRESAGRCHAAHGK
jgi:hypothetical protein